MKFIRLRNSGLKIVILMVIIVTTISSCDKDNGPDQREIEHALIEQYVADNQLDGKFSQSGLYYVIEKTGNGNFPYSSAIIQVSYKGFLLDGYLFEEGYISAAPLNSLLAGWQEGLRYIDEGGKIKLIIPSHLAYGDQAIEDIPMNSVLVFNVTLHAFEK